MQYLVKINGFCTYFREAAELSPTQWAGGKVDSTAFRNTERNLHNVGGLCGLRDVSRRHYSVGIGLEVESYEFWVGEVGLKFCECVD